MSGEVWRTRATGEEMLMAAPKGDVHAFNQLVQLHQGAVYNLAYRVLGDADAAADVTQRAFLSAHKVAARSKNSPIRLCVLRLAANACHNRLRAAQRRTTPPLANSRQEARPTRRPMDPNEQSDTHLAQPDREQCLQAGILTLPAEERVVLVLSDVLGLNYPDIAHVTGLRRDIVSSHLSQARVRLRDYLLAHDEESAMIQHR
jgi:RNA polymerase sigma factor (sigma-70 family)